MSDTKQELTPQQTAERLADAESLLREVERVFTKQQMWSYVGLWEQVGKFVEGEKWESLLDDYPELQQ